MIFTKTVIEKDGNKKEIITSEGVEVLQNGKVVETKELNENDKEIKKSFKDILQKKE